MNYVDINTRAVGGVRQLRNACRDVLLCGE